MSKNQSKKGLKYLEDWFSMVSKPGAEAYVLAATGLFEQKKKREALNFVNHALKISTNPRENWLQFAVALNLRTETI